MNPLKVGVPKPIFSTTTFNFFHRMHWTYVSSYLHVIPQSSWPCNRSGHKHDRPWSSILEHVLHDWTSSTHFEDRHSITFSEWNQIQTQLHRLTSWTNKPFTQLVDQENNYFEYNHNYIEPSIWGCSQGSPNYWNDALVKQLDCIC
jgi:hypothetical protein